MERVFIADAAHVTNIGYVVDVEFDEPVMFSTLKAAAEYATRRKAKWITCFDRDNEENFCDIQTRYADRYTKRDIEDRLIANAQQGGRSFLVADYR